MRKMRENIKGIAIAGESEFEFLYKCRLKIIVIRAFQDYLSVFAKKNLFHYAFSSVL